MYHSFSGTSYIGITKYTFTFVLNHVKQCRNELDIKTLNFDIVCLDCSKKKKKKLMKEKERKYRGEQNKTKRKRKD